jgi:protocatechuate 3,4-dioxygenase beta subunit
LTLTSSTPGSRQQISYTAVTDTQGRFAIREIVPGIYRLTISRSGYVQTEYGSRGQGGAGTPLTLAARQSLASLEVRLRRHGVIAGRVVDDTGEPVERTQVSAMRYRYVNGERQMVTVGSDSTDDQGNYRIFGLEPGRYYVRAAPGASGFSISTATVSASQSQPQLSYLPVYYPGTTDQSLAVPVEVESGKQVTALAFTLTLSRSYRLQAQVQDAAGVTGSIMGVLRPRNGMMTPGESRFSTADGKSRINLQGVAPGSYTLTVAATAEQGKAYGGRVDVDIADRDETDLVVALSPGLELPGEIRVEESPEVALSSLHVTASTSSLTRLMTGSATYTFGSSANEKVGEDGKFLLPGLSPDKADLNVTGLPDGFYIKSIQLGDQEILESGLDLSKGAAGPLRIVLRGDAATLEGSVSDNDSKPMAAATVVLIPKSESRRRAAKFYKTAVTDQQGHFTLKSVEPGEYKIYAWEDVETMAWMDVDFVKPVEGKGVAVTVDAGSRQQLQLKAIAAK